MSHWWTGQRGTGCKFLIGQKIYRTHQLTYGSELIRCGHCGSPITGERKTKHTRAGDRDYVYYRCAQYHKPGHPRIRLTEAELDEQVLVLFDRMRVGDDDFRHPVRASPSGVGHRET